MRTLRGLAATFAVLFTDPARQGRGFRNLKQGLGRALRWLFRREQRPPRPQRSGCCVQLPPEVYKRPDPLIYAQYYLQGMGLAVTWDNPDIQLYEIDPAAPDGIGAPVPSWALVPDRPYLVRVRIWNGSFDAPAPGLPVHLSFYGFGVATTSTEIGVQYVTLGVKGSPLQPAFALFEWRTPAVAGHYCLQARLHWDDDANPNNNLGQENTTVGVANSPAVFSFQLRNDSAVRRRYRLELDGYRLPELQQCADLPDASQGVTRLEESKERWQRALREQGYGGFDLPADWVVLLDPAGIVLAAGEEREVTVTVDPGGEPPPPGIAVNVHAFALAQGEERVLVGGVTAYLRAGAG